MTPPRGPLPTRTVNAPTEIPDGLPAEEEASLHVDKLLADMAARFGHEVTPKAMRRWAGVYQRVAAELERRAAAAGPKPRRKGKRPARFDQIGDGGATVPEAEG